MAGRWRGSSLSRPVLSVANATRLILDIHGGPQAQDDFGFSFDGQLWAANGYLVVKPNFRGSTGYGYEHCVAIWHDWGGPDFLDVMAAVDDAIERGWADPERMGVMGWSYGGMLTNHVITKTDRFKAAATGASATLYAVNYGHDMYIRWWEQELGFPWVPENRALYEKMSPFNRVDQVTTPTLILGGEIDWNVPIINSEQLYLALKRLGVETQLIVYPGEYHGIDTPSHAKDLYQRYLDWFGERLPHGSGHQVLHAVVQHAQRNHLVAEGLAAGDAQVFHARPEVKFLEGAADGLGEDFTHDVGGVDAVAGVALAVVHVAVDAAQRRDAVDHDADLAAPFVFDGHVYQRRVQLVHARGDHRLDAFRVAPGVVAAPAKHHAPVRGEAEIIQNFIHLANGQVLRVQLGPATPPPAARWRSGNCRPGRSGRTSVWVPGGGRRCRPAPPVWPPRAHAR